MKKLIWLTVGVAAILLFAQLISKTLVKENEMAVWGDCCYHATVYLQPYDDFSHREAKRLKADIEKHIGGVLDGTFTVEVLPGIPLPDSLLGESKAKYRTDKMIDGLKGRADEHNIYIGLTHRDICREQKNGVKDWGVVGSSIAAYHACVVSDHRLNHKKSDLWKVAMHEFYPHIL